MFFKFTWFGTILIIISLILLYIAYYCLKRREDEVYYYLGLAIFSFFLNFFFQGLTCNLTIPFYKIFFGQAYILGFLFSSVLWLFFTISMVNHGKEISKKFIILILTIPILGLILSLTDPWTHLYYVKVTLISTNDLMPFYKINNGFLLTYYYNILIEIVTVILIIFSLIKGSKFYNRTYIILLVSTIFSILINFISYTNSYSLFTYLTLSALLISIVLLNLTIVSDKFNRLNMVKRKIVEDISIGVCYFDLDDNLIKMNKASEMIGVNKDLINSNVGVVFKNHLELLDFYKNTDLKTIEVSIGMKWIKIVKKPLIYKNDILGVILISTDITSEKFELKEKDILIKEVHSRVKNNLQIILSLLNLDLRYYPDNPGIIIQDTKSRLQYLSVLHEKIYKSSNLSEVNVKDYLTDITTVLFSLGDSEIELKENIENINIDVDTAIPLGLIVTEVVNNTIKYAFPDGNEDAFFIDFIKKDDKGILNLYDNGVGFGEDFNFEDSKSLGMVVIKSLIRQLEGEINILNDEGAHFCLIFPLK